MQTKHFRIEQQKAPPDGGAFCFSKFYKWSDKVSKLNEVRGGQEFDEGVVFLYGDRNQFRADEAIR